MSRQFFWILRPTVVNGLKRWLVGMWLGLLCLSNAAMAQAPAQSPAQTQGLVLSADVVWQDLAPYVEVLEDPTRQLTLQEVQAPSVSPRFSPWRGPGELNLGYTASAWWIRVTFRREVHAPSDWLIEMPYLNLDELDFHAPGQAAVLTGNSRPLQSRPVRHRFFVFPFQPSDTVTTVYIRVASAYSLTVPMVVWQPQAFERSNERKSILQWLYYGGLLALLLYNLLIYFSLRDIRFVVYAAYVGVFSLAMLAGNGLGRLELWPNANRFDAVSQSFFLSLAAMLSMVLTRVFLNTPRLSGRLNLGLTLCAVLFGLLAVSYGLSTHYALNVQHMHTWMMVMVLPGAGLIMAAGLKAVRSRQTGARFFVLAWSCLWLGALVSAARALGWLPTNGFTAYSLQLSSGLEMLLLALALADLIRLERTAKAQAQAQALKASETMVSALRAAGERLEQAVAQRTQELAQSLEQERRLHEQQSRLGALISHEFRNPLGIIDSQISLIRKEKALGRMPQDKRIDTMSDAVRRLRSLFDTWLTSDRVRKSLEVADLKPLQLDAWLRHQVQIQDRLASNHVLQVEGLELACWVMADVDLLEIALSNLIDNACKYSPAGTTVRIQLCVGSREVGLCVHDEGPGIEHSLHTDIFQDYYRAHPEGVVPGFGLGLAFVARVAALHHGRVELQSELGQGSAFCLWLPTTPNTINTP